MYCYCYCCCCYYYNYYAWHCVQMRSTSGSWVRATSVSFPRRGTVRPTTVPLLRLTLSLTPLLPDSARSVPALPDVVDRRWSDGDGLPSLARGCSTVSDVGRVRSSTAVGRSRWWRLVCPTCSRFAVAAIRETRDLHVHRRVWRRPRYATLLIYFVRLRFVKCI